MDRDEGLRTEITLFSSFYHKDILFFVFQFRLWDSEIDFSYKPLKDNGQKFSLLYRSDNICRFRLIKFHRHAGYQKLKTFTSSDIKLINTLTHQQYAQIPLNPANIGLLCATGMCKIGIYTFLAPRQGFDPNVRPGLNTLKWRRVINIRRWSVNKDGIWRAACNRRFYFWTQCCRWSHILSYESCENTWLTWRGIK